MKSIICLILIVMSFDAISQKSKKETLTDLNKSSTSSSKTLKSFWGIPFGTSLEEVKKLKPNLINDPSISKERWYCFDCNFGNYKGMVGLQFNKDNKMCSGFVQIIPEDNELCFEVYDDIVNEISKKYGPRKEEMEKYLYPYDKSNGRKFVTSSIPKSTIQSAWIVKSSVNSDYNVQIGVVITREFKVSLIYDDLFLIDKVKKTSSDY